MAACSDGAVQAHPDTGGRAPRVDDRAGEDGADDRADWMTEWADDVEPNRYHRLHRQARIAMEKELSSAV